MLALDVLVEAEQLVSWTGAGVVLLVVAAGSSSTTSRAGMCIYGRGPYFFILLLIFKQTE